MEKAKTPQNLLQRQQITVGHLKTFLLSAVGTRAELKSQCLSIWGVAASSQPVSHSEVLPPVPVPSVPPTVNTEKEPDKKKNKRAPPVTVKDPDDATPTVFIASPPRLNNWWAVKSDRGVVVNGILSTTGELYATDVIEMQSDDFAPGVFVTTIAGDGYVLGEALGLVETSARHDCFGPWPTPMTAGKNRLKKKFRRIYKSLMYISVHEGHSVVMQLRANTTAFTSTLRHRMLASMSGDLPGDLATSSHVYRLLQLVNGLECRDAFIKQMKEQHPEMLLTGDHIAPEQLAEWSQVSGVNAGTIKKLEDLFMLNEQLNDNLSKLHEDIYFKNKTSAVNPCLANDVIRGGEDSIAAFVNSKKLRTLQHAEERATQRQKDNAAARVRVVCLLQQVIIIVCLQVAIRNMNAADSDRLRKETEIRSVTSQQHVLQREIDMMESRCRNVTSELRGLQLELTAARDALATDIKKKGSAFNLEIFTAMAGLETLISSQCEEQSECEARLEKLQERHADLAKELKNLTK